MPCKHIHFPDGTVAFIRYANPRRKRCKFCAPHRANFVSRLCDFEVEPGKTCDAPMCSACARPVGPDRDFCPAHSGERTMPEHYTRNTLEATCWCNPCNAMTQHRVDSGRRGPCLECIKKLKVKNEADRIKTGLKEEQRLEQEKQNPRLFE